VGMLLHQTEDVQGREIGVESAHSFGDVLFNIPLIKAIHDHFGHKVTVTTRHPYVDGFNNVPWVKQVIPIDGMGQGVLYLQRNKYRRVYQITQNVQFPEYKKRDGNHSLIDTPLWFARSIGIPDFDQRPIFIPSQSEIDKTNSIVQDKPTIAIECEARSGQSWARRNHINDIVYKYKDSHRILWLSNKDTPNIPCVDSLARFTRREVIMCLRAVDIMFSVGSGFFCSALALPTEWQPKKIVCLWIDDMYKYTDRLNQLQWHKDIVWINNESQLKEVLNTM